uniref:SUEL-type lectin domain-containing protein n=1 Tax=Nelumbo nucifera TaxID=4432 RepID=A0A822ZUR8_NELNU|nr:TPA_asm: hypothetical protein HUJ06_018650 [Nelumbo nucifera]
MGGNPSSMNFNTVTIGTACANVYEGNKLDLTCQGGRTLSQIRFASFGDPQGICGSFAKGCCEANNDILSLVGKVLSLSQHTFAFLLSF